MIKIGLRHNLIYLLMLIIFNFARKIDSIIMDQLLKFDSSLLLTLIMFLSEFITGCILFVYAINIQVLQLLAQAKAILCGSLVRMSRSRCPKLRVLL